MSQVQVLKASISVLKALYTIALFTAKAIVYICIALYVVGELLFSELSTAPAAVEQSTPEVLEPIAVPVEPIAVVEPNRTAAKAMPVTLKAIELPFKGEATMFDGMKAIELRKVCQTAGVKWRNAHGANKHMNRSEMVAALMA